MTALAIIHRNEIINSIAQGKRLFDLSQQFKVSPQAISKALHDDPEYQVALETGHAVRLDQAEGKIEGAVDQIDVARAGALWRAVSWRAEREVSHRWGAKQQMQVSHSHSIDERLTASLDKLIGRVVEGQHSRVVEGEEEGMGVMSNTPALQHAVDTQHSLDSIDALIVGDDSHPV